MHFSTYFNAFKIYFISPFNNLNFGIVNKLLFVFCLFQLFIFSFIKILLILTKNKSQDTN